MEPREFERNIKNNILKKGSLSSLIYKNNWMKIKISKGLESWGAGNNISIGLSEYSEPYNYFLLSSDYGKLRVRYIHGFMEKKQGINRYLTAKGLEWTNKKSVVIGFSETIIYSGKNRPIEIGYLNPLSFHLESELNNRLSVIGNANANAIWQLHSDLLIKNRLRISLNYLIDEFVLDKGIQIGKEHGKGYSLRFALSLIKSEYYLFNFFLKLKEIGTPTFRHSLGDNNFVQNSYPLGLFNGSDLQEYSIGLNYFYNKKVFIIFEYFLINVGEESILNRSYDSYFDYKKGPFPSGRVDNYSFLKGSLNFSLTKRTKVFSNFIFDKNDFNSIQLGIDSFFSINKYF